MDFQQCVIEAIEKAPNEGAKEQLRRILEECEPENGEMSTLDSGGHGGTLPPKPPKPGDD